MSSTSSTYYPHDHYCNHLLITIVIIVTLLIIIVIVNHHCNYHHQPHHYHFCNHLLIIITIITLLIIIIIVIHYHCNYHHHNAKMCLVGRLLFQTADSEALHQFCGRVRCVQILSSTFRQIVILSMSCRAGCVQIFLKLWMCLNVKMSYNNRSHVKEYIFQTFGLCLFGSTLQPKGLKTDSRAWMLHLCICACTARKHCTSVTAQEYLGSPCRLCVWKLSAAALFITNTWFCFLEQICSQ